MKILIDENVPEIVRSTLKQKGYYVEHVNNVLKGKSDIEVFNYAQKKKMCIITKDIDFKSKIKEEHSGIIKICGIILNPSNLIIKIINIYKENFDNIFVMIFRDHYIECLKKYTKKGKFKQIHKLRKNWPDLI